MFSCLADQEKQFIQIIRKAHQLKVPLQIHCRDGGEGKLEMNCPKKLTNTSVTVLELVLKETIVNSTLMIVKLSHVTTRV